jgi:hypothetical protein
MQINYIAPLSRAWARMIKALFKPFHINKWFALGFTAFLAGLIDWEGASSHDDFNDNSDFESVFRFPDEAWRWLNDNPDWFALIISGVILAVALILILTWLSSRGKFMFLDNVVHDRALVKIPWADFKQLGNSLFMWRLGFGIIGVIIFGAYVSYFYYEMFDLYESYAEDSEMILAAIKMGSFLLVLILAAAFISLFLNDFIVPLMYKTNSKVWIGWSRFIPLFSQNFFYFILYGLLVIILYVFVAVGILFFGLITCCVGIFILIIPYIGSVLFLPVSVTFRAFSVEFLEQFGEQYKIFPEDNQIQETNAE